MRWAKTVTLAPLGPSVLPSPTVGRAGLIAAWEDDASLDAFLSDHRIAAALEGGYRVRLKPLRIVGAWPELGELDLPHEQPSCEGGSVAVLTLGRLRLRRALPFLRASARAEADALASPALLFGTGLARPPRIVATFSLWRDVAGMREYVEGVAGGHRSASRAHAERSFHHASAFIRFRPYDEVGRWEPAA